MSNLDISRAQRLDQKVTDLMPGISRSFAAKLIEQGKVTVNGEIVLKPGFKISTESKISVDYDLHELEQIPDIEIPILYEDDDCLVINKPVGVLTHSKGAYNPEATVATWLRKYTNEKGSMKKGAASRHSSFSTPHSDSRAGIVHRLDRATSGVMICAKNPTTLHWLQKQFSLRKVKKSYVAIIEGTLEPDHAVIDMPIERNPKAPAMFRVGSNGKSAITEYSVEKTDLKYSLVRLTPTTGRTHQLRVHLNQLGHPIVGDIVYSGEPADRLYLHAETLEITLLNRERKVFTSPVPKAFNDKLKQVA